MFNPLLQLTDYYDSALIYKPNVFFVVSPVFIIMLLYWLVRRMSDVIMFVRYIISSKSSKLNARYRWFKNVYLQAQKQYKRIIKKIADEILLPEDEA
ncbi:MAG: hypothetical protein AAB937_00215 [Patescibacteria group bacterium]